MVVTPSRSESSFRSYRAFSFSSLKAPTRLPVGVGGVETGSLEAGDRCGSNGGGPVAIEAFVPELSRVFVFEFEGAFATSGRRRRRRNGFSGSGRSQGVVWSNPR